MFNPINNIKTRIENNKKAKTRIAQLDRRIADLERRIDNYRTSFMLIDDSEKSVKIQNQMAKMGVELRNAIIEHDELVAYGWTGVAINKVNKA